MRFKKLCRQTGLIMGISMAGLIEPVCLPAYVEMEPVMVKASRIETSISEAPGSVTVITAEEIAAKRAHNVAEVLKGIMGVEVSGNGGPGQIVSVFIRGAASERTLVMLNGVPLNDPVSPARSTDLSKITVDNIERIEIIRGPQSVVYGSSAMGGVINIITKKGGKAWAGSLSAEAGKYSFWMGKLAASGSILDIEIALGASLENTRGFSAAKRQQEFSEAQPAMDPDGYRNLSIDLNLDYRPLSNLGFSLKNRYLTGDNDLDNFGGNFGDDPDSKMRFVQTISGFNTQWDLLEGFWQQELNLGLSQTDRAYNNPPDPAYPFDLTRSEYRSRNLTFDWQNKLNVHENEKLVVGICYQQEQGMYNFYSEYLDYYTFMPAVWEDSLEACSAHLAGGYLESQTRIDPVLVMLGIRYDEHDQYGEFFTYRAALAWLIEGVGTRIKSSYGTAFNLPSLYQRYSSYGNEDIKAEFSRGGEVGIETSWWQSRIDLGAVYFRNDYQDQIGFDYADYKYLNIGKVVTKGWETFLRVRPRENIRLNLTYTRLIAQDL
ncbi:TonB-dependent receptor, partial [bacterium]|nr:TonB-dependent receptor [bacterium]